MQRKILLLIIIVTSCCAGRAQSQRLSIHGTVIDSLSGQTLEDATVSLLHWPDGGILHQRRSGKKDFVFPDLTPGAYRLITTYLGYKTDTLTVDLDAASTATRIRIRLHHSSSDLIQAVVTAAIPPAIVRNDTIAFNAAAFPTRPNSTVEDLLRKLPGFEVDKNGNITMQGQKVDKIYLDGKEFFLNDPRTASQNLPADIVDQIEAFDSQTEKARLTGIRETTGGKSLNIRLKKNRKRGYFGKVYAGTGTSSNPATSAGNSSGTDLTGRSSGTDLIGSYSAGGTATSLGKSWLFASANVNNMNNQFTGTDNKNGPGGGGLQTFNNAQLNFRNDKNNKLSVTLNAGTNGVKTILNQATQQQTYLTDSSLLQNSYSQTRSHTQSYHGNAFLEYTIDTNNLINLRSAVTPQKSGSSTADTQGISTLKTSGGYLSNQGNTYNSNTTNGYSLGNQFNFRRRWHLPGRTLLIGLTENHQDQNQPQTIFNLVNNYDSTGSVLSQTLTNQVASQHSTTDGYGASLSYTEPLRPGHIIDFSYRINQSTNHSDRQSFDFDSATGKYDLPDTITSNHFINDNTTQRFSTGLNATDGKFRYQLGITLQVSDLNDHNVTADSSIRQREVNWYPRASMIYTPSKGTTINIVYSATTTAPTIQQLQPLPDLTNPFLVRIGNPGLLQQLMHSVNASYTTFNSRNFQNLQISLQGNYTEHEITPSTTVLSGGIQQIQYVNVNGVWHVNSNITYGFPLGDQRKGNSSISMHSQYGRDVSLTNGATDVTTSFGWGGSWKLNFHPVEKLFVETIARVNYTGAYYSINAAQNTQTWLQNYSIDFSYELPFAITLTSNYNWQITGRQGSLPQKSVALWNASIFKNFLRDRSGEIRLSAFGILNAPSNYTQSVGVNYLQTQETNLPGRIILLSFIYRFHSFPLEKKKTS
jgi:hypothetical protein